jgi:putative hemolysin
MAEFILIVLLLLFAILTAASETSITAVSRVKLRRMASSGSHAAKTILKILEAPEKFFGAILVANNIVDVLLASILTVIMIHLLGNERRGVLCATVLATVAIIISEVTAKTLAARRSERISFALAKPTDLLIWALSPVVNILARFINFVTKVLGVRSGGKPSLVTEEEIRGLIKIGEEEGAIGKEEGKMLSKIFEFGDTTVRGVMTPKSAVVALDVNSKYEDIMRAVLESGYSRLPVYRDTPDNIIGVINVKDLLNFWEHRELIILQDMIYQPTFVAGSRKVNELLKEFQKGKTHMAIVVDSQGKIEGVVTLEDLLEEIVGEISDEYDVRKPEIEKISEDRYALSDRCRLKRLNREFNLSLPEKEFVTIGSYIRGTLKRLPAENEKIPLGGWACVVKKIEGNKIVEMECVKTPTS